jgi:ABC-type multidrug transport system ATPase subunit
MTMQSAVVTECMKQPTSGLDVIMAQNLIAILKGLAQSGRTIVITVHQPNSVMYQLFDNIMLLAKGEVVYWGPAHEAAAYFGSLGFPLPSETNPADWFMNLVHINLAHLDMKQENQVLIQ